MSKARIGIVTVSDRASAGIYEDLSGKAIIDTLNAYLTSAWEPVYQVIPDEQEQIEATLIRLADLYGVSLDVLLCRNQIFRFKDENFSHNSGIPAAKLNQFCKLGEKEQRYMEKMFHKLSLTARTYHKILRVARTIADTQKAENIRVCDLTEAVCYRSIGDKFWGGMEE